VCSLSLLADHLALELPKHRRSRTQHFLLIFTVVIWVLVDETNWCCHEYFNALNKEPAFDVMAPEVSLVFWIHDLCLTACPVHMKTHCLELLGVCNLTCAWGWCSMMTWPVFGFLYSSLMWHAFSYTDALTQDVQFCG